MNIVVAGASGATGKHLVQHLLNRGHNVKAIVRSSGSLPESIKDHERLTLIQASILDLSDEEMTKHVKNCEAIACCLGHNLSFKGIFGPPHRLVTEAVRRLSNAIISNHPERAIKFVLMNTVANRNRDLNEQVSFGHKVIVSLLRLLLPPHPDNEKAADFLRTEIGQNHSTIEWTAVRPDALVDEDLVTNYVAYASPIRDAFTNAGKTSRINVGHFMAELITNDELWNQWKGKMPVIYNQEDAER